MLGAQAADAMRVCVLAAPCKGCSNQHGPYALGVSLKCRCQKPAVTYSFVFGSDVSQFKHWKTEPELKALYDFQKELGANGNALLFLCDTCNCQYLAQVCVIEVESFHDAADLNTHLHCAVLHRAHMTGRGAFRTVVCVRAELCGTL